MRVAAIATGLEARGAQFYFGKHEHPRTTLEVAVEAFVDYLCLKLTVWCARGRVR